MAVVSSPGAALGAALEMQAARGVRLRIGIHAGPACSRAGDFIGHEVNVAARIAERALSGDILDDVEGTMYGDGAPRRGNAW